MFGLGRNKKEWSWIAYGKHPAIKDYITIGKEGPFFTALSKWIDGGFRSIKREIVNDFSWRFIATTIDSHLVCGILKNSRDSMNRTFPLLVMGNGYLKDWAVNWSYMPFA